VVIDARAGGDRAAIQLPRRGGTCVWSAQPHRVPTRNSIFSIHYGRRLVAGLNGDTNPSGFPKPLFNSQPEEKST